MGTDPPPPIDIRDGLEVNRQVFSDLIQWLRWPLQKLLQLRSCTGLLRGPSEDLWNVAGSVELVVSASTPAKTGLKVARIQGITPAGELLRIDAPQTLRLDVPPRLSGSRPVYLVARDAPAAESEDLQRQAHLSERGISATLEPADNDALEVASLEIVDGRPRLRPDYIPPCVDLNGHGELVRRVAALRQETKHLRVEVCATTRRIRAGGGLGEGGDLPESLALLSSILLALELDLVDEFMSPPRFLATVRAGLKSCAEALEPVAPVNRPGHVSAAGGDLASGLDALETGFVDLRRWLMDHAALVPSRALPCTVSTPIHRNSWHEVRADFTAPLGEVLARQCATQLRVSLGGPGFRERNIELRIAPRDSVGIGEARNLGNLDSVPTGLLCDLQPNPDESASNRITLFFRVAEGWLDLSSLSLEAVS